MSETCLKIEIIALIVNTELDIKYLTKLRDTLKKRLMITKTCTKCKEEKGFGEFHAKRRVCKKCYALNNNKKYVKVIRVKNIETDNEVKDEVKNELNLKEIK